MSWIIFAIFSYTLFAFSSLVDRYLLAGPLRKPLVYAFYISATGLVATLLVPFGFYVPSFFSAVSALAAGAVGVVGLFALYRAISHSDVSRVIPMMGASLPIMTLILAFWMTGGRETLPANAQIAFPLLIFATALLALDPRKSMIVPSGADIARVATVSFLFALAFVLSKLVYNELAFVNGFIWMRWGGFLAALSLLVMPDVRRTVFRINPMGERRIYLPFIAGAVASLAAFLAQQYAVFIARIGELALINALQGVQYLLLLLFVVIIGLYNPKILNESLSPFSLAVRAIGIVLLVAGIWLLFVSAYNI